MLGFFAYSVSLGFILIYTHARPSPHSEEYPTRAHYVVAMAKNRECTPKSQQKTKHVGTYRINRDTAYKPTTVGHKIWLPGSVALALWLSGSISGTGSLVLFLALALWFYFWLWLPNTPLWLGSGSISGTGSALALFRQSKF